MNWRPHRFPRNPSNAPVLPWPTRHSAAVTGPFQRNPAGAQRFENRQDPGRTGRPAERRPAPRHAPLRFRTGRGRPRRACRAGAPAIAARLSELVKGLIGTDPFDTEALVDRLLTRARAARRRRGDGRLDASRSPAATSSACRSASRFIDCSAARSATGSWPARWAGCPPSGRRTSSPARPARSWRAGSGRSPWNRSNRGRDPARANHPVRAPRGGPARRGRPRGRRARGARSGSTSTAGSLRPLAIRFIRSLERVDPVAVADPVRPEHLPWPRASPISAGHRLNLRDDFFRVLSRRGCDTIRLDLSRCGGFTEAKKIAVLAESHGVSVSLRNLPGPATPPPHSTWPRP